MSLQSAIPVGELKTKIYYLTIYYLVIDFVIESLCNLYGHAAAAFKRNAKEHLNLACPIAESRNKECEKYENIKMFLTPPALRATSPSKGRGGAADAHNHQIN